MLRTVYAALKPLPADFALERPDAGFLVQLDGYGTLVVTEQAGEGCREGIDLEHIWSDMRPKTLQRIDSCLLWAHGLAGALLALSHGDGDAMRRAGMRDVQQPGAIVREAA